MEKITNWQYTFLVVNTILPTAVLTVPAIAVKYAEQQAWVSILIATAIGVFVVFGSGALAKKFPDQALDSIAESLIGRWFGKVIGFLFMNYFLFVGVVIVREFSNFMSDVFMPNTPLWAFSLVVLLMACYAVYQGIEVFVRINVIILVTSFSAFLLSTMFSIKNMNIEYLFPLWDQPIKHLVQGAVVPASWMSECAVMLFLLPKLKCPQKATKYTLLAVLIIGLSLTWTLIGTLFVLGADLLPHLNFPTFNTFRTIKVSNFLEHIDALFIAIWISTVFAKISVFFFGFHITLKSTFHLQSAKTFILPTGLLWVFLSVSSWSNSFEFNNHLLLTVPPLLLFFNVGLVYLLLLLSFFTKRKNMIREPAK